MVQPGRFLRRGFNQSRKLYLAGMIILLTVIFAADGYSQYFGRNKVKYETFNFEIMETEDFNIYFYPPESLAVRDGARMMERWNARLSPIFNHKLVKTQPIIIYANHADFQQTNVIGSIISQGTGGFTESRRNRIVLPLTGVYRDNNHVIGHELVHAFQYDLMASGEEVSQGAARQMPLWFIEGMAEYLSIGRQDALTAMWLRDAVIYEETPSFTDISRDPRYFPYRWGHAIWAYIGSKYGDRVVGALYRNIIVNGWDRGFENVIHISPDSLSKEWQNYLKQYYRGDQWNLTRPDNAGDAIITGNNGFNLAPSISPDGKYVAFLSRRNLFSIDLYLADAQTGKVIKKLVSSTSDAHFDALRFMDSAGSWSPDGKRFAFVVYKSGDNAISIVNVETQEIEQTIKVKPASGILNVAWSPDGESIVYSGLDGGISDLFLYNLRTGESSRLTNDWYANIQPSWSPDGTSLLFITDQGPETIYGNLAFGSMKIGVLDLESGDLSFIQLEGARKHINPQYSRDGKNIYFVADRNGYSNIYRYAEGEDQFYQITDISTGVTGLTELSPAFSLAWQGNRMVFSVFQDAEHNIYARDFDGTGGEKVKGAWGNQGREIPVRKESEGENLVDQYMSEPIAGLPSRMKFPVKNYSPSLHLISAGQTGIGLAVDRYGAALGGAVTLIFSDMLGNHMLGVSAQVNGSFKDIGGQAIYMNLKRRLNWGGLIGHIPYRSVRTFTSPDTVNVNGNQVLGTRFDVIFQRIFVERAWPRLEYPLSQNRRLEFSTGYTRIAFNQERETFVVSPGGVILDRRTEDIGGPPALNLSQTSLAYVGDYSFFGFTSPINGSRYRFEVQPTFGSLRYMTALADYRHYFFANPVTFAFRLYHQARYLKDSEDERLSPLFLGYETLVRGYGIGSIDAAECSDPNNPGMCPVFDRLVGSRIGVFNAEFRLPLFGTEQFGLLNFPYLPTELVAFFDGGVAWTQEDQPELVFKEKSSKRIPVFSTGVAARVNLLGYIVGQVYYAIPFQRPEKNGVFGFVLAPGW